MEWKYVHLLNRNFLCETKCKQDEKEFQCRMITEGKIEGLLKCEWHRMDGKACLIYDITSLQNLNCIYSRKKVGRKDLSELLFSLKEIKMLLETYLLEIQKLYIVPEFIFKDIDTKKFYFLYYPYLDTEENDGEKRCMDFLLSLLDPEDEELVDAMYSFYDRVTVSNDSSWIEALYETVQNLQREEADSGEDGFDENEKQEEEITVEDSDDFLETGEEKISRERIKKAVLFSAVYILAAGGLVFYVFINYILSIQEQGLIVGLTGVATGIAVTFLRKYLKKPEKQEYQPETENEKFDFGGSEEEEPFMYTDSEHREPDGNTVYFEQEREENKLYGIGKDNRNIFSLKQLPFIIGRKKEAVDGYLEENSVSRMHARFYREEKVLYMEDLNSTNGTYKNGILLAPHEKVEVYPEDEIRFGKMGFVYR